MFINVYCFLYLKMADRKKDFHDCYYKNSNKNYAVLVEADKIGWKKARKTKEMFARKLEKNVIVPTLEGPLNAKKGDWLCMGVDGELWPQDEPKLLKKFNKLAPVKKTLKVKYGDGEEISYNDFFVFKPKPEKEKVFVQIPNSFIVHASWGVLNGKKGDYLCKWLDDGLDPDPQDVWVVDKDIFERTHEIVHW
jgi:hypothetical protein